MEPVLQTSVAAWRFSFVPSSSSQILTSHLKGIDTFLKAGRMHFFNLGMKGERVKSLFRQKNNSPCSLPDFPYHFSKPRDRLSGRLHQTEAAPSTRAGSTADVLPAVYRDQCLHVLLCDDFPQGGLWRREHHHLHPSSWRPVPCHPLRPLDRRPRGSPRSSLGVWSRHARVLRHCRRVFLRRL